MPRIRVDNKRFVVPLWDSSKARWVPNGRVDWNCVLPCFVDMMELILESGFADVRVATFEQIILDLENFSAPQAALEILDELEADGIRLEFQAYEQALEYVQEYRHGVWEKRTVVDRTIDGIVTFGNPDPAGLKDTLQKIHDLADAQMNSDKKDLR